MTGPQKLAILPAIPLAATACAIAGSIDAIAYLLFGKIFIANMTGNTVLFAASVLAQDWKQAELRIGVVVAFVAGILAAHAVLRKLTCGRDRRTKLIALMIEFIFLVTLVLVSHPHALRMALLLLLAFAMGLQNDAVRTIGGVKLNTAFITGDLEKLGSAVADSENPAKRREARLRVLIFLSIWIAYAIGALLGAFGAFHFAEHALWLPAGFVVLAALLVLRAPPPAGLD